MDVPTRVKQYIEENDRLVKLLGVEIEEVREGYAKVSLRVEEKHMNAAGVCQGGVIFTLADLAFALASNSHGKVALALEMSISYLKAVPLGERLTAEAKEEYLGKRTATYIITVFTEKGEKAAILKGTAFRFVDRDFPPE